MRNVNSVCTEYDVRSFSLDISTNENVTGHPVT